MNGFYKQVTAVLAQHGFFLSRQAKGSHEIWSNGKGLSVSVAVTCKSRHTANSILKDARIPVKL